jgi:hypothetical protein
MTPCHPRCRQPASVLRTTRGALLLALAGVLAACGGGGLDPILGGPGVARVPTVTSTLPATATPIVTGVDTNTSVQATFSKPMQAATLNSTSFTLACPAATPVAGTVSYNAGTQTATLKPTLALPPSVTCVATLSTAVQDSTGIALGAAHTWSFSTGLAAPVDTTRPTVVLTVPAAAAVGVATNTRISATFSEPMAAASLSATSFTLAAGGAAVVGTVAYDSASRTATFTPTTPAVLANATLYTATITAAATDVAGNGLAGNSAVFPAAGNQVWTFTTGAAGDTTPPTVTAITPANGSTGICLTKSVSATFSEPMDTATINGATFGVFDGATPVLGSVSYDAASRVATFVPIGPASFAASHTFTVTVRSGATGVKDLAGNALATDRVWTFTTGTQPCIAGGGINLGTAASFGAFGGAAGITNQGINTVIGGNLGTTAACTLVTGLHDATNSYTQTPLNVGVVSGSIQCAPPAPGTTASLAVATQARADAQAAYTAMAALPPGGDPGAGQLGGLVLASGVYTAAGGTFAVTTGDLTLDAQGDVNAVWVFQMGAALTVGLPATPRRVLLVNGAQARNVFWQIGSAGRIEDGSTMAGTLIAPAGVTISTAGQTVQTTLVGRAIGLTASVTVVNTTIVAP